MATLVSSSVGVRAVKLDGVRLCCLEASSEPLATEGTIKAWLRSEVWLCIVSRAVTKVENESVWEGWRAMFRRDTVKRSRRGGVVSGVGGPVKWIGDPTNNDGEATALWYMSENKEGLLKGSSLSSPIC